MGPDTGVRPWRRDPLHPARKWLARERGVRGWFVGIPVATTCSYTWKMEVGIREAKSNLSKLVASVGQGEKVYLTSRGQRVAEIIPATTKGAWRLAYGSLSGKITLYPGWDSPAEDKKLEHLFEALQDERAE